MSYNGFAYKSLSHKYPHPHSTGPDCNTQTRTQRFVWRKSRLVCRLYGSRGTEVKLLLGFQETAINSNCHLEIVLFQ